MGVQSRENLLVTALVHNREEEDGGGLVGACTHAEGDREVVGVLVG